MQSIYLRSQDEFYQVIFLIAQLPEPFSSFGQRHDFTDQPIDVDGSPSDHIQADYSPSLNLTVKDLQEIVRRPDLSTFGGNLEAVEQFVVRGCIAKRRGRNNWHQQLE